MAGMDKDFQRRGLGRRRRARRLPAAGTHLDETLNVRENVMLGVADKKAKLDRFNELAMNYSDETADEMAELQDEIDADNLWDLDSQIDVAMEALRCPPDDADVSPSQAVKPAASRSANCCSKRPTCCCSTNRPTTSTPKPSPGCNST